MNQNTKKKSASKQIVITQDNEGRRIDNYLLRYFDNIPKSRIYQMIRKGEVRVNKGRIKQTYRLVTGDRIRIPPVYQEHIEKTAPGNVLKQKIVDAIIYENDGIIIINKPSGVVVHSGSGQANGVIEAIRATAECYEKLELVHRLDKDTSGCLILAKTMPVLKELHTALVNGEILKSYYSLLSGQIDKTEWVINERLNKNKVRSGERVVTVDKTGKTAITEFFRSEVFDDSTLVSVELVTGRTHQIRVHSAYMGHPVIGDDKYGERDINSLYRKKGLKRLFLHARSLEFKCPSTRKRISIEAPLPDDLKNILDQLRSKIAV